MLAYICDDPVFKIVNGGNWEISGGSSSPALSLDLIGAFEMQDWIRGLLFVLVFSPGPLLALSILYFVLFAGFVSIILSYAVHQVVFEFAIVDITVYECFDSLTMHLAVSKFTSIV